MCVNPLLQAIIIVKSLIAMPLCKTAITQVSACHKHIRTVNIPSGSELLNIPFLHHSDTLRGFLSYNVLTSVCCLENEGLFIES